MTFIQSDYAKTNTNAAYCPIRFRKTKYPLLHRVRTHSVIHYTGLLYTALHNALHETYMIVHSTDWLIVPKQRCILVQFLKTFRRSLLISRKMAGTVRNFLAKKEFTEEIITILEGSYFWLFNTFQLVVDHVA